MTVSRAAQIPYTVHFSHCPHYHTSGTIRAMKRSFAPTTIYLDNRSEGHALTQTVLARFPKVPVVKLTDTRSFIKDYNKRSGAITQGKRELLLTVNKGAHLKKCPGTKNYICCGYQILHQASQCSLDCSYCILQSYFNNPLITFFTNVDNLFAELDTKLDRNPNRRWRIGTGEFTDSLVFDEWTEFSRSLITHFATKKNAVLELKTKTANVANVIAAPHGGNVVISWSMNAASIACTEERDTATLAERLRAARTCQRHGCKVGFHFDPIIAINDWEQQYAGTIDQIFAAVDPARIAWISMGCFRFMSALKPIIEERFPKATFVYHEFIKGIDGKMRYPKPLRVHLYTTLLGRIRRHSPSVFVYLCMESSDVWQRVFGYTPRHFGSLAKALDQQVF